MFYNIVYIKYCDKYIGNLLWYLPITLSPGGSMSQRYLFQLVNVFKTLVSLTLVTSFFETSKLWACIIYALEGLECQGQYRAFAGYRDQREP